MRNSPLNVADVNAINILDEAINGSNIFYGGRSVFVPFPGKHQAENCINALTVIDVLKEQGIVISEKAVREGISKTKNPARCEIVSENPLIILDGCHNEDSARALRSVIEKHLSSKRVIAVMGMMQDKDIDNVLKLLLPFFDKVNTVPVSNPRAVSAQELSTKINKLGTDSTAFDDSVAAIQNTLGEADENTAIIVCGSLYLCSDVYNKLPDVLIR